MKSTASTPTEYMDSLPVERKKDMKEIRAHIKKSLSPGYKEIMAWGMITYVVPLSKYPKGYGGNPKVALPYLSLASQKNYMALYMMNLYGDPATEKWFVDQYKKSGKKLDMGKGCLRFKRIEDLPLELISKVLAKTSVDQFIKNYELIRNKLKSKK